MHILLTDITTCPRCGPEFGLILLVNEVAERRVVSGALACPNCREKYPVQAGVADFRRGAEPDWGQPLEPDAVQRLVALAGVTDGPGYLLLAGPVTEHAATIAAWLPDVEQVLATSHLTVAGAGTNQVATADALPFRSGVMAAVVLSGGAADALLEEAARVLMLVGRLVLHPVPENARERLAASGLRVVAQDAATMVAMR